MVQKLTVYNSRREIKNKFPQLKLLYFGHLIITSENIQNIFILISTEAVKITGYFEITDN